MQAEVRILVAKLKRARGGPESREADPYAEKGQSKAKECDVKCPTVVWPGPSPSLLGKPKFIFQGILKKKKASLLERPL